MTLQTWRLSRAIAFFFALTGAVERVSAQNDPSDERLMEAFEEAVDEGRDHATVKLAASLEKTRGSDPAFVEAVAIAAENLGDLPLADRYGAQLLLLKPRDPAARVFRLRQLRRRGDLEAVDALVAPWIEPRLDGDDSALRFDLAAAAEAALALIDRGRDDEAKKIFDAMIDESKRVIVKDPYALVGLAEAYLFFGRKQGVDLAEKTLIEAQELLPRDPYVGLLLAKLYLERKYLHGDAVEETKAVLKFRPNHADALRYQALIWRGWTNAENFQVRAAMALATCLDVRPDHPDATVDRAYAKFADGRYEEGRKLAAAAATVEPRNLRALSALAAADYLEGDHAASDAAFAKVLALDPTFGDGRAALAETLNLRRRWPEALEQAKKAAEIDPKAARHFDAVAQFSLFLAQTPVGLEALKKANELDAYNWAWRRNMEMVLATLRKRYVDVETDRFLVRVPIEERPALRRFYGPFFDRSYELLTQKYGYVPEGAVEARGRVTVEMFDDVADFGARTFGYVYPGFLGVCFGPLVTLNGPKAMPAELNSWARTFHHEFAHSITVGLAKGRMPRWLTEGLSTYEEIAFEPSWTRGMDRELFDAWATEDLCKVGDFDVWFGGPRTIYAYYQAGLVAEMMVEQFGMPAITNLLRAYGDDLSTDRAFRKALGVAPEEVDRRFAERVAARVGGFGITPTYSDRKLSELEARYKTNPKEVETVVRLAVGRYRAGRRADAESAIAAARALGSDDPRLLVVEAWRALDLRRPDAAEAKRAAFAAAGLVDYDVSYALGVLAAKKDDAATAEIRFREAIAAYPTDAGVSNGNLPAARVQLIKLLRAKGAVDDAMELAVEHLKYRSEDNALRKEVVDWRLGRGEKAEARKLLDLHVLIDARDHDVHLKRGTLQLEAVDAEGASISAEMALDCAGDGEAAPARRAAARVLGAEAARALGRFAEARAKLGAALVDVPGHVEATALLEKLPPAAPDEKPEDTKQDRR